MTLRRGWADVLLRAYDAQDRALVAAGSPATSRRWRADIERFLRSGRRRWVIRAGRRAGKSSTMCRLAVVVALWGGWSVPPGDIAVVAFVSVSRDEAAARLRTISEILRVLGVPFERRGDELELTDRPLVFRVVSCSIRGTVGFTSIAIFCDEMARWESRDSAANPAREVAASLRPTMASQPNAIEVDFSSPWGTDDFHAELFDAGDTAHQIVSHGATWEYNPTISEQQTHELEPDEATWSREYAAVPGATVSAAFDREDALAMFENTDASLRITEIGGWSGPDLKRVTYEQICDKLAERAKALKVETIYGDQREEAGLRALLSKRNVGFRSIAWTQSSKDEAAQLLRKLMRAREIGSIEHPIFEREVLGLKARLTPSGNIAYDTNGKDYVSALITFAHVLAERGTWSGPFLAIDASSLRGDAFTYIAGRGRVSGAEDEWMRNAVIAVGSERGYGGKYIRVLGGGKPLSEMTPEERRRAFMSDDPRFRRSGRRW